MNNAAAIILEAAKNNDDALVFTDSPGKTKDWIGRIVARAVSSPEYNRVTIYGNARRRIRAAGDTPPLGRIVIDHDKRSVIGSSYGLIAMSAETIARIDDDESHFRRRQLAMLLHFERWEPVVEDGGRVVRFQVLNLDSGQLELI